MAKKKAAKVEEVGAASAALASDEAKAATIADSMVPADQIEPEPEVIMQVPEPDVPTEVMLGAMTPAELEGLYYNECPVDIDGWESMDKAARVEALCAVMRANPGPGSNVEAVEHEWIKVKIVSLPCNPCPVYINGGGAISVREGETRRLSAEVVNVLRRSDAIIEEV